MASTPTDQLFKLIKTLTKAEKRSFKLYVNRIGGSETAKFIQLFDVLDKQREYDEEAIFRKIPTLKRSQLSNLKRHLLGQLLTSLRLIHISKYIDIEIREQIDYARILYGKGLYLQALKILDRVKKTAREAHQDHLHLEIVEFEKLIESRHITRSIENRAEELTDEAQRRGEIIYRTGLLSGLALKMYGLYIKIGHIRDEASARQVDAFFKANVPPIPLDEMTFFEKVYWNQAHMWYNYILQNFPMYFRYATKWVELFDQFPDMRTKDPDLYMRGLHHLLGSLFYLGDYERFCQAFEQLSAFIDAQESTFNINSRIQAFLYRNTARINKHFLEGTFTEGLKVVPEVEAGLEAFRMHLDSHRVLVFYYKIACLYFGSGDNDHAIDYLNRIIHYKAGSLGEDIQCYARILHLIAHYELGHYNLLEYLVKSVYRFLVKMKELNAVQKEILRFLRRELYSHPERLREAFKDLRDRLEEISTQPYERRSYLYLDISSWLEAKIHGRTVEEVVQEKFKSKRPAARVGT